MTLLVYTPRLGRSALVQGARLDKLRTLVEAVPATSDRDVWSEDPIGVPLLAILLR